jgi:pumilio RNA-binding family
MNDPAGSSRATTIRPDEAQAQAQAAEQQPHHQHQAGQQQNQPVYVGHPRHSSQQSLSQHTLPQHTPFAHQQQAQYYTPVDTMQSPALYPSSFQQSPVSAIGSMDPTTFETFRSTPDPYAPIYGLPGPASLASSSSPQSSRFTHQGHQGSDPSMFMYPTVYPHGMPGMAHQGMMRTGPGDAQGAIVSPNAASASHNAMVMQGMSPFPPQSPMLMSMAPSPMDRLTRRDSLSYHQQAPVAIPAGTYNMGSQWATSPPGHSNGEGGFMHSHTPSWPVGFEYRSSNGMGHQRVLSGHQPFSPPVMTFMPGSMSPPSSFVRPAGGGRMGMHSRTTSNFSQFSQQRSPQSEVQRSPLLEEFRAHHNKSRRFELQDIQGYIAEFSSDQHGSRFTQEKLDTASSEDLKMVFDELLPSALILMKDVFGNYVIQKLFEHGTPEMRLQFIDQMQGHILSLSLGTYGCRVVQKALEYVGNKDQMRIADELRRDVLTCVRDQNANHVVQKVLECISPTMQVDFIPQTFRNNVYSLAAHCYSCRVLQRIFEHCEDSQRRPLIDELLRESEKLMHDQYGNYVIQWILQNGSKPDRDFIIGKAKGNVLVLSRHKYASNVVEQIIRAASPEERYGLIEEIMTTVEETNASSVEDAMVGAAIVMMKDQYGNYVLQRFLELSQGQQRARLVALVKPALYNMKRFSSGYAKHLAAIERLLEAGSPRGTPPATMTSKSIMTGEVTSASMA